MGEPRCRVVSADPSPPQGPPLFLSSPLAGQSSSGAGRGGSGSRAGRRCLLPQGPHTQSPPGSLFPCVRRPGQERAPAGAAGRPACVLSGPWCCAVRLGCGARTEQGAREGRAQLRPPLPVPPREGQDRAWQVCRGQQRGSPGSWRGHVGLPQGAGPGPGCGRVEVMEGAEIMTCSGQCMAYQQSCRGRLWPWLRGPSSSGWGLGLGALCSAAPAPA